MNARNSPSGWMRNWGTLIWTLKLSYQWPGNGERLNEYRYACERTDQARKEPFPVAEGGVAFDQAL